MMPPDTDISWWPDSAWTDMRAAGTVPPLWLREDPHTKYWLQYLPADRLVYAQYNQVANGEDESIGQFADRLRALVESAPNTRLLLDLRLNRGGNGSLNRPLLLSLIKSKNLEGRGKLFVVIGRSTFSAAQFLVNELEQYTDAVFVGEPSGGKANSYGDSRKIILPNSKITVRVSTLWWQEDPRDIRQWKGPDVAAELTFRGLCQKPGSGVRGGPCLPGGTCGCRADAERRWSAGLSGDALRRYRQYKADPRHAYVETEEQLNSLGYTLLENDRAQDAIAIFRVERSRTSAVGERIRFAWRCIYEARPQCRSYPLLSQVSGARSVKRKRQKYAPRTGAVSVRREDGCPGKLRQIGKAHSGCQSENDDGK